jgi:hypothetical protein
MGTVAFYFVLGATQENATAARNARSYQLQDTNIREEDEMRPEIGLFFFLSVGAVALFSFIAVATWVDARQKERQAYYESETLKKIAETQGAGANPASEFLREKEKIARAKTKEGLKIGGLVNVGVGLALLIFLGAMQVGHGVYLAGLVPLFIGLALLAYPIFLAPKE